MSGLFMIRKVDRNVPGIPDFLAHDALIALADMVVGFVAVIGRPVHAQMLLWPRQAASFLQQSGEIAGPPSACSVSLGAVR